MLEKPDLQDDQIAAHLREAYGRKVTRVDFLPLGADLNTAVYRVGTRETGCFLKLRKEDFAEISALVPWFLHQQGIQQIIPPLPAIDGQLWTRLKNYTCILYPFIEGSDAFQTALSAEQWASFGKALRRIHSTLLPPELLAKIPGEEYSPRWRNLVQGFLVQIEHNSYQDPVAAKMAAFMWDQREVIGKIVKRAGELAAGLQLQPLERELCHSDIHGGNLLLTGEGGLYIVDWDNPVLAPKEHDLMYVGGGVGAIWNSPREEALFYRGYGTAEIDLYALIYYRYERIVQDIAAYCQQILVSTGGGEDRMQGFRYFTSQFLPGEVVEIAIRTDQML